MNLQFSTNGFLATALLFLLSCSPKEQPMQEVIAKGMDMALKQSLLMAEPGTNGYFILKHSVGYLAKNSEVDLPLTYADYYYVEALVRYNALIGGTLRK